MDLFNFVTPEIWASVISILPVLYSNPFFLQTQRREILSHKLLYVYTPLKKAFDDCINITDKKQSLTKLKELTNSITSVIDNEYAYCPEELIHHVNNLKDLTIDNKLWIYSIEEIIYLVYYEELYCQRKLKYNTLYNPSYHGYPKLAKCFKKIKKFIDPMISPILIFNSVFSIINLFVKMCPQEIIFIFSLILCALDLIDYLITKKILSQKLQKIQKTTSNQNSPK